MKATDLRLAAKVYDLHPPDSGEAGQIVFGPDGYASYEGLYAGARRPSGLSPQQPVAVDGLALRGILSSLKDEEITVGFTDSFMTIRGTITARLRVSAGHPWQPPTRETSTVALFEKSERLLSRLDMMRPLTDSSKNIGQPVLTGVSLKHASSGQIVIRATDGRRAMIASVMPDGASGWDRTVVAPLHELRVAVMAMGDQSFAIVVDGGTLWVDNGTTMMRIALLSGEIPSFEKLPRPVDKRPVSLTKEQIDRACKAAASVDADHTVRLRCRNGTVTLLALGKEMGDVAVPCTNQEVEDIEIKLSAVSLLHAAKISKTVCLTFESPRHPFLMRHEDVWYWATPIF